MDDHSLDEQAALGTNGGVHLDGGKAGVHVGGGILGIAGGGGEIALGVAVPHRF